MSTLRAHTQPEELTLSLGMFGRLVPFGVLVDGTGLVRSLGPSLKKIASPEFQVGRYVFEMFDFKKPRRLNPKEVFQDALDARITMEVATNKEGEVLSLFGMAFNVVVDHAPHVALVVTPGVNARWLIEDKGLRPSDFSPGDGSPDLLPLLAMQEEMTADSKKAAARLKDTHERLQWLAHHDSLTDLPNRRALMQAMSDAILKERVSVVHVDLDEFKALNDTFGHAAGDAALKHTASCLRSVFGGNALCARFGGDEFVVLLRGEAHPDTVAELAVAVIAAVAAPFSFGGETLTIGASAGIAHGEPEDVLSSDEVLHRADLALYEAKRKGRGSVQMCTKDLLNAHSAFQELSADIRRGLEQKEFVAHFQPQLHAESGALIGLEALARWNHPDHGLLLPGQFLEAAQRTNLLLRLDQEVRRSALETLEIWDMQGLFVPKMSLNVTVQDLVRPEFAYELMWDVDARKIAPQRLMLEIVEAVLYDENADEIRAACERLTALGFSLALDDFGTGHASALSLVNLPIAQVKIDRAFAADVAGDARKQVLASAMIDMATNLGVNVLAEGVNSALDVKTLQGMGCTVFQAFHFYRPMARDAAAACIKAGGFHNDTAKKERIRA